MIVSRTGHHSTGDGLEWGGTPSMLSPIVLIMIVAYSTPGSMRKLGTSWNIIHGGDGKEGWLNHYLFGDSIDLLRYSQLC